jgi:hypothetical protein
MSVLRTILDFITFMGYNLSIYCYSSILLNSSNFSTLFLILTGRLLFHGFVVVVVDDDVGV